MNSLILITGDNIELKLKCSKLIKYYIKKENNKKHIHNKLD